jgi:predicted nucleotidyltransferase
MRPVNEVEHCCKALGIDFYIIGAVARDIWFSKESIQTRYTKDLDLAVLIAHEAQFDKLKQMLINDFKYSPVRDNSFALISKEGQVDILPFGKIEVQDGVQIKGKGLSKINVNGFQEVYNFSAKETKVLDGHVYKVATLPGIVLLKLVAFDDRPEVRFNDPIDIGSIIKNYFALQQDAIYDHHSDLFSEDRALDQIAARVIGREMKKPLTENDKLKIRVENILKGHIDLEEKSRFVRSMATSADVDIETCVSLLKGILQGINDKSWSGLNSLLIGKKILERIEDERKAGKTQQAQGVVEFLDPDNSKKIGWLIRGELGLGHKLVYDINGNPIGTEYAEPPYLKKDLLISKNSPLGNAIAELSTGIGQVVTRVGDREIIRQVLSRSNYQVQRQKVDAFQGRIFTIEDDGLAFEHSLRELIERLESITDKEKDEATIALKHQLESLRKDFEEAQRKAYRFRRTTTSIRQQFLLDQTQNKIKRQKLFNGPLIIDGGPGTGKTTLLIHRIQYLLDSNVENDENFQVKLTHEEKVHIRDQSTGWIFFSPTPLLKKYLEQAMSSEGLNASDDTVKTWEQHRNSLKTSLQLLSPGPRGLLRYADSRSLWQLSSDDFNKLITEFDSFHLEFLKKKLDKLEPVSKLNTAWKDEGVRIYASLSAQSVKDLPSLIRAINNVIGQYDALRLKNEKEYDELITDLSSRVQSRLSPEEKEWFKNKIKTETRDEDEEEGFESETYIGQLDTDINRAIRRAIRNKAIQLLDPKHQLNSKDLEIIEKLPAFAIDRVGRISSSAVFQKYLGPIFKGPDEFILAPLVSVYKKYREENLVKAEWLPEDMLKTLQLVVAQSPKNKRAHDEEIDFLIMTALKLARIFRSVAPELFNKSEHTVIAAYKSTMKGVVAVDEAADFSLVQLYCMYLTSMPRLNSVTFCGDLMQQMNTKGVKSWTDILKVIPDIEESSLVKSYRQTPRLLDLAIALYKKRYGKDPNYYSSEEPSDNPAPLLKISENFDEKIQWIAGRIAELYDIYESVIPNIAIFVKDSQSIQPIADALNQESTLADLGITVKPCLGEGEIGSADHVRVFNITFIKGMEFESVFFIDVDNYPDKEILDKLIYVGVSRATYYLAITLNARFPEQLQPIKHLLVENETWSVRSSDY